MSAALHSDSTGATYLKLQDHVELQSEGTTIMHVQGIAIFLYMEDVVEMLIISGPYLNASEHVEVNIFLQY